MSDLDLLAVLREAREALQFANDTPNGPIHDTIWMMHRPETLFDFLDAAIAQAEQPAALYECNACAWKGREEDTVMLGSVGPLCPECRETTEST